MTDKEKAEYEFLKYVAGLRGICDECKTKNVMIALSDDDKWLCFECRIREPDEMQPNTALTGGVAVPSNGVVGNSGGGQ